MDSTAENSENAVSEENEVASQAETAQTNGQDHDQIEEPSGWLLKRSKISHKWKKQWFQVKATELHYGDEEGVSCLGSPLLETLSAHCRNLQRADPKNCERRGSPCCMTCGKNALILTLFKL